MRYDWISGWDEIIGGADGAKDKSEEAVAFLSNWSDWLYTIIGYVVDFFNQLKSIFEE